MSEYFGAMGTALFSTLAAGTALVAELGGTLIYRDHPPEGAERPYVIFSHAAGGPENLTKNNIRSNLWLVRGYAATRGKAVAIDREIDALLDRKSLTISGNTNFWTAREEDVETAEAQPNNERIYSNGGFYRYRITDG